MWSLHLSEPHATIATNDNTSPLHKWWNVQVSKLEKSLGGVITLPRFHCNDAIQALVLLVKGLLTNLQCNLRTLAHFLSAICDQISDFFQLMHHTALVSISSLLGNTFMVMKLIWFRCEMQCMQPMGGDSPAFRPETSWTETHLGDGSGFQM